MDGLDIIALNAAMAPDRLFPIRTHVEYGFFAGRDSSGRSLLAAVFGRLLLIAYFDIGGNLTASDYRELKPAEGVDAALRNWFGWESGLVEVKQFRVSLSSGWPSDPIQATMVGEEGLAVTPVPMRWLESLADLDSLGVERPDFEEMVRIWVSLGQFALYWGDEFHLDGSGEVVAT